MSWVRSEMPYLLYVDVIRTSTHTELLSPPAEKTDGAVFTGHKRALYQEYVTDRKDIYMYNSPQKQNPSESKLLPTQTSASMTLST
jgi:hypothetical protein